MGMTVARTTNLVCDVCGKATERIVAKLLYVPMIPGVNRSAHSNYTHHCDVGVCCQQRLVRGFRFRKRQTAGEYHASRRNGGSK